MRIYSTPICLLFLCVFLSICPASRVAAQPFQLTVNNGFGGGAFQAGDTVFVGSSPTWVNDNRAAAPPSVFNRWTASAAADTIFILERDEYRTRFVMPSRPVTLTATYRSAAPWTATETLVDSSRVFYFFPPAAKAVIFLFHGAGGSADGWITRNIENRDFCNAAVADGYGIIAAESLDRTNKRWNPQTDVPNLLNILSSLAASGALSADALRFGVGMSQGGGFVSQASSALNLQAQALYCIPGTNSVMDTTRIPTIWNMMNRDTSEVPSRNEDARANFNKLFNRSIRASFNLTVASPVHPQRFRRIPGVDSLASTEIYTALKSNGQLTALDFFATNPRTSESWKSSIPALYSPILNDIEDQLFACFTEHLFHGDANARTIAFFNTELTLSSTPVSAPQPDGFGLQQNYPNPFNPATVIPYTLPFTGDVRLKVFDVLGREVAKLVDGRQSAGRYSVRFNGAGLSSGLYFYQLTVSTQAGGLRETKKMLLVK